MKQYHNLLETILEKGTWKEASRSGMPKSISYFGHQMRFNLLDGFPIVATKKVNFSHIVTELLWFLRGDTNIKYLIDNECNIWNEDAYNYYKKLADKEGLYHIISFEDFVCRIKENKNLEIGYLPNFKLGDCGKQYGWLWRNWEGFIGENDFPHDSITSYQIDQIKNLIEGLKTNPEGRRHIITAWNPATLDDMALPACHSFVQFNCRQIPHDFRLDYINALDYDSEEDVDEALLTVPKYYLDCHLYQRSGDSFLGVPYNVSSYALLTHIIAKICNMQVAELVHTIGDVHIYESHINQVKELLRRDSEKYKLPELVIHRPFNDFLGTIDNLLTTLKITDFDLKDYESYPSIKAPLSTGLK